MRFSIIFSFFCFLYGYHLIFNQQGIPHAHKTECITMRSVHTSCIRKSCTTITTTAAATERATYFETNKTTVAILTTIWFLLFLVLRFNQMLLSHSKSKCIASTLRARNCHTTKWNALNTGLESFCSQLKISERSHKWITLPKLIIFISDWDTT